MSANSSVSGISAPRTVRFEYPRMQFSQSEGFPANRR